MKKSKNLAFYFLLHKGRRSTATGLCAVADKDGVDTSYVYEETLGPGKTPVLPQSKVPLTWSTGS